ncbi:MAG: hypothetical protein CM15mV34_0600 [Caudoviricetes sp.]|nr:MAG: hypothetical protein CM15mV34_0600 [Caudoviricetes sp.]
MNRIGFIAGWKISDEACDGLIDFFEESPDKKAVKLVKVLTQSQKYLQILQFALIYLIIEYKIT